MGLSKASGQAVGGLNVVGYSITDVPPLRSGSEYESCGEGWYANINYTWDYEQNLFADCGWDSFMLHFIGFITIPDGVDSVRFGIASDDGSDVTIAGHQFGLWEDKGCSVDYSDRYQLDTNVPLPIDAWMYENGGGTCFMLMWQFDGDNQDWMIVPESAFSVEQSPTTTRPETTTTEAPPSTTVPSTTSTSAAPVATTLQPVVATTQTSSSTSSTSTTSTSTTTTEPTTTTSTIAPDTTQTLPEATTTTESPTTTLPIVETTTTLPAIDKPDLVSPEVANLLTEAANLPAEEVQAVVALAVEEGLNPAEAIMLATNESVIEKLTPELATEVFNAIDESTLSDATGEAIVNIVQKQPEAIRNAFEGAVNVFGGHTDTYIPVGSVVTVKQRRVIIVVSALTAVAVVPSRRSSNE